MDEAARGLPCDRLEGLGMGYDVNCGWEIDLRGLGQRIATT